jgi:hypothetical protein
MTYHAEDYDLRLKIFQKNTTTIKSEVNKFDCKRN